MYNKMAPNFFNNSQFKVFFFTDHEDMESNFQCDEIDGKHFLKFIEAVDYVFQRAVKSGSQKMYVMLDPQTTFSLEQIRCSRKHILKKEARIISAMSDLIVLMTSGDRAITIQFFGGSPTFSASSIEDEDEDKKEEEYFDEDETPKKLIHPWQVWLLLLLTMIPHFKTIATWA